jgi:hypothetical protein
VQQACQFILDCGSRVSRFEAPAKARCLLASPSATCISQGAPHVAVSVHFTQSLTRLHAVQSLGCLLHMLHPPCHAGIALDTASLYGGALQSLSTAQEGTALPEGGSTSVAAASTTTGPFCCDDDMSAVDVMAFPVGLPRKLATYLKLK